MPDHQYDFAFVIFDDLVDDRLRVRRIIRGNGNTECIGHSFCGFNGAPIRGRVNGIDASNDVRVDQLAREFGCAALTGFTQTRDRLSAEPIFQRVGRI